MIWLASYPRSGNTLMRLALQNIGIGSTSIYHDSVIDDMFEGSEFCKTHGLIGGSDKAIYIVRDGRDALVSHAHYRIEIENIEETYERELDALIDNVYIAFVPWCLHVMWYFSRDNVLVVRFEDMLSNLTEEMMRVAQFAGFEIPHKVEVNFEALHTERPEFFRRGIVGAWRDEMSEEQQGRFWANPLKKKAMEMAGYNV
jgi:hypothetical protein